MRSFDEQGHMYLDGRKNPCLEQCPYESLVRYGLQKTPESQTH